MAESGTLDITVAYRERIALPPDAVVEVRLLDTSRMDVAAELLSSQRFRMTGVPFALQLAYDPALIDPRFTYTVSARILSGGRAIFRSTTAYPVLTRGAGNAADLMLERAAVSPPRESHVGSWRAVEIAGQPPVEGPAASLSFESSGQFALMSGCNSFAGRAQVGPGTLSFPAQFPGTLMACPPPLEAQERALLSALGETAGFTVAGDELTLADQSGAILARFRRQ